MKFLGSREIETQRLILHKTEEKDLKPLWEMLKKEEVSKYYLVTKINKDWEKEKKWQYQKLEKASNNNVFCWTIEEKNTKQVIGQISVQENKKVENVSIRDIGYFLDIPYQKKGYAYEALIEVLKYMFLEVEITEIITCAAKDNPNSWFLMEKLGFKRQDTTHYEKYTLIEEPIEVYEYQCFKNDFLKEYFRKEKLYITESIDKDPYIRHLSDDFILNITGESGSGKSTLTEQYQQDENCIVIDTDHVYYHQKCNKEEEEFQKYLIEKYHEIPDLIKNFDQQYLELIVYFQKENKLLVIDSAQYRNIKDISILKGDIIILRTCINTCYNRCMKRYHEKNPKATLEEIGNYQEHKKNIYKWYHSLNNLIDRIERSKNE